MNLHDRLLAHKPPRIAWGLILVALIIYLWSPALAHAPLPLTGGGVFVAGLAVMLRAWWLFRRHGVGICPTDETTMLIVDDVYAISRHPMYLGMLVMLTGLALATGALPFYAAAAIQAVVLNNVFCEFEESKLESRFGRRYVDYRQRVRRWL